MHEVQIVGVKVAERFEVGGIVECEYTRAPNDAEQELMVTASEGVSDPGHRVAQ